MPMYQVEWVEVKTYRANVLIPNDDKALQGALTTESGELPIVQWVEADSNPVIAPKPTEYRVTQLGRIMPGGKVRPL